MAYTLGKFTVSLRVQRELFLSWGGMFSDVMKDASSSLHLSLITFNMLVFKSDLSSPGCKMAAIARDTVSHSSVQSRKRRRCQAPWIIPLTYYWPGLVICPSHRQVPGKGERNRLIGLDESWRVLWGACYCHTEALLATLQGGLLLGSRRAWLPQAPTSWHLVCGNVPLVPWEQWCNCYKCRISSSTMWWRAD